MNHKPLVVGNMYPFYTNPEKEEETFEGWGKILEFVEERETFLFEGDLYQLHRVKVEFSSTVPSGEQRGRLNSPFSSDTFTTHKIKRTLLLPNPTDKEIATLSHTPARKQATLGKAYYQHLNNINYENEKTFNLRQASSWRAVGTLILFNSSQPKRACRKRGIPSRGNKREWEAMANRQVRFR